MAENTKQDIVILGVSEQFEPYISYDVKLGNSMSHRFDLACAVHGNEENKELLKSEAFQKRFMTAMNFAYQRDDYKELRRVVDNQLRFTDRASEELRMLTLYAHSISTKLQNQIAVEESLKIYGRPKSLVDIAEFDKENKTMTLRFNIPESANSENYLPGFTRKVQLVGSFKENASFLAQVTQEWKKDFSLQGAYQDKYAFEFLNRKDGQFTMRKKNYPSVPFHPGLLISQYSHYAYCVKNTPVLKERLQKLKSIKQYRENRFFGLGKYYDKLFHSAEVRKLNYDILQCDKVYREADNVVKTYPSQVFKEQDYTDFKAASDMLSLEVRRANEREMDRKHAREAGLTNDVIIVKPSREMSSSKTVSEPEFKPKESSNGVNYPTDETIYVYPSAEEQKRQSIIKPVDKDMIKEPMPELDLSDIRKSRSVSARGSRI